MGDFSPPPHSLLILFPKSLRTPGKIVGSLLALASFPSLNVSTEMFMPILRGLGEYLLSLTRAGLSAQELRDYPAQATDYCSFPTPREHAPPWRGSMNFTTAVTVNHLPFCKMGVIIWLASEGEHE